MSDVLVVVCLYMYVYDGRLLVAIVIIVCLVCNVWLCCFCLSGQKRNSFVVGTREQQKVFYCQLVARFDNGLGTTMSAHLVLFSLFVSSTIRANQMKRNVLLAVNNVFDFENGKRNP